jgi:hypothetical protein
MGRLDCVKCGAVLLNSLYNCAAEHGNVLDTFWSGWRRFPSQDAIANVAFEMRWPKSMRPQGNPETERSVFRQTLSDTPAWELKNGTGRSPYQMKSAFSGARLEYNTVGEVLRWRVPKHTSLKDPELFLTNLTKLWSFLSSRFDLEPDEAHL